jgi:hypothetical protein
LLGELSRNVETACSQLREDGLFTKGVYVFIKPKIRGQKYIEKYFELPNYTNSDITIMKYVEQLFDENFNAEKVLYKKSGITCVGLKLADEIPDDLFGEQKSVSLEEFRIMSVLDKIRYKYGFGSIGLASSLEVNNNRREDYTKRHKKDFYESGLPYPYLGVTN